MRWVKKTVSDTEGMTNAQNNRNIYTRSERVREGLKKEGLVLNKLVTISTARTLCVMDTGEKWWLSDAKGMWVTHKNFQQTNNKQWLTYVHKDATKMSF